MPPLSPAGVSEAAARLPRVRLAHLPTPLEECPRLSAALGDARVWIKRDDATGLAFGGNKARQLEFTLGDALAQGADCIVQGAGSQSNHCRQTAAACARLGLDCFLCLRRDAKAEPPQGNLLLDRVHVLRSRDVSGSHADATDADAHRAGGLAEALPLRAQVAALPVHPIDVVPVSDPHATTLDRLLEA